MQEKFLAVWNDIESAIGSCCLHKSAAFLEASGKPLQKLLLVTSASESVITEFLGKRNVDNKVKNRYIFTHENVPVELTTHCDVEDMDELYQKSFRHSLTIDSIAVKSDGMVSNSYGGMEDVRDKILRLTDDNGIISEGLYRRIISLHAFEGFSFDNNLRLRIENDKPFQKESYRKKFCEIFVKTVRADSVNWEQVARLLETPGCTLDHKKAFVAFTQSVTNEMADERFKRTFIFMIMALLKVTSKELQTIMAGVEGLEYYDSLCANMMHLVQTQADLVRLKSKYG